MKAATPRVTLKNLAEKAGLSVAAVSMALRNHPRISKATCERVQALAKKSGYKPDPALSALVAYRQDQRLHPTDSTIALVYVAPDGSDVPERETKEELRGITESSKKLGYALDIFNCGLQEADQARLLRIIRNRGIRGIIFQFLDSDPSQLISPWGFVAAVGIGIVARSSKLPLPTISGDHLHGSYECVKQVGKLGYLRPALLIPISYPSTLKTETLGGYLAGLRECPGNPQPIDLTGDFSSEGWQGRLSAFIAEKKPDILISAGRAHSFHDWLRKQPELSRNLSLCTLDAEPEDLRIGGMLQDRHGVGVVAMESLHKLILANIIGPFERPQAIHIPSAWRQGNSLHLPNAPRKKRSLVIAK